jgi:SM-20-related protein
LNAGAESVVKVRELDGQRLHVVDGLFDAGVVRLIFETLARQSFSLSDVDTEATRDIRHWKCEFPLDYFEANPALKMWHLRIVAKARELCAPARLELKRVHCNSHLYGDLQNAHTDISPGVTALYFANTTWQDDWQGETIFYDRAGEPFHAIAPKPGRLLVFAGEIVHRGGVPSRKCFEARLSVAFKFEAA